MQNKPIGSNNLKKEELHIISKYFNKELNNDELDKFSNWLKTEKNQKEFEQYTIANHISDLSVKKFNADIAFEKLTSTIDSDQKQPKGILLYFKPYYKYAAILLMAILLSFYFTNKRARLSNKIASIVVPVGEKRSIELPDGTKVLINSASTFSYNEDFLNERVVKLDGEAYFEVPKHKGQPFIVKLNNQTSIKVLGTSFDVKSYHEDARIETTLFEGKIEIISDIPKKENVIINPNTIAIIDKQLNTMKLFVNGEHTKDALSWKKNKFIFHHEYLSDIIHELNRSYNVQININSDELEYNYFSASFDEGTTVTEILRDLSISGNFSVNKVDSTHFEINN